jgi:hypothetical protein
MDTQHIESNLDVQKWQDLIVLSHRSDLGFRVHTIHHQPSQSLGGNQRNWQGTLARYHGESPQINSIIVTHVSLLALLRGRPHSLSSPDSNAILKQRNLKEFLKAYLK